MISSVQRYDEFLKLVCEKLNRTPRIDAKDFWIPCVFHSEKDASLHINRSTGQWNCFGCKHGGRSIKYLLELNHMTDLEEPLPDENFDPFAERMRVYRLKKRRQSGVPIPLHRRDIPPSLEWRGLSGEFLSRLGVQMYFDPVDRVDRVWIPCWQNEELEGWVARVRDKTDLELLQEEVDEIGGLYRRAKRTQKKTGKRSKRLVSLREKYKAAQIRLDNVRSYRNAPGMVSSQVLLGYDFVAAHRPSKLVLVEGPVDGLTMMSIGLPALAILGTQSWSAEKRALVLALDPQEVVLLMDGDRAGRTAAQKIRADLHDFVATRVYRLREGVDPAESAQETRDRLIRYCRNSLLSA